MAISANSERQPGRTRKTSIRVQASLRDALHEILTVQTWPEWRPGLMDVANPYSGPLVNASQWHETWNIAGRTLRFAAHVERIGVPATLGYVVTGHGMEASVRWKLTPDDATVRVVQEVSAHSLSVWSWLRRLPDLFVVQQEAALGALRERLQEQRPSPMLYLHDIPRGREPKGRRRPLRPMLGERA